MMAMMNRLQQRNCTEVYFVTAMQPSRQVPILIRSSTNRQLEWLKEHLQITLRIMTTRRKTIEWCVWLSRHEAGLVGSDMSVLARTILPPLRHPTNKYCLWWNIRVWLYHDAPIAKFGQNSYCTYPEGQLLSSIASLSGARKANISKHWQTVLHTYR